MKANTQSPVGSTDYDVIIVGGGPVGLLLACLLKKQGVRLRVLERRAEPIAHSAAIGITPPSLQILEKLGLAAEFIASGLKVRDCFVHGQRGRLGCVSFREIPDAHRFILSLPQVTTIEILQKHLGQEHLESGCEVSDVRQHDDHCSVQAGERTLTARFVIACDGSRSRVRELIGMQAPGHVYGCHFVMGDFVDRTGFGDEAHLFFTSTGSVESFPLPGGQRRWVVQTDTRLDHPPPGLVSELTRLRTGIDVPAADQINESVFTPRKFNCDRYYKGRIILCGDAAHGMSPIGGQGMNTGFADAEFLAALLCHDDPLKLLPAYNRFRRKAAKTAIFRAEWGMWLGTWRGRARSRLRDVILKFLLCQGPVAKHMGSFYAMLTIPFNTLKRVPEAGLQPRPLEIMTSTSEYTPTIDGAASHYDDLDQFYREIWGEHIHHGVWLTGRETDTEAAENLIKIVAELGHHSPNQEVCDIGCGYGTTAKILAQRHGVNITGMTISAVQLAYAQANNSVPGKTRFMLRDWYDNQLPDNHFDIVQTVESLEHMPDLPTFFRECYRVMKPGGRLVATAWMSCENPDAFAKRHFIDAITRETQIAGVRPESEFRAATEGAGFVNYQFKDYARQVKRTWPLCALRTVKGLLTKAHYRRFLFSSQNPNRIFALTLFRIWLAYELGIQRYGVFSAEKR